MTLTRWKLLTGTFGLAVCGIAALAEPACQKSKQNTDAVAQANCAVPPPVPVTVPLPMPAPLPEIATVVPVPLSLPPVETTPAPKLAVTSPADAPPVTLTPPVIEALRIQETAAEPKTESPAGFARFLNEAIQAGEPVAQPVPAITLPAVVSTPPMPAPVPVPVPVNSPAPPVQMVPVPAIVETKTAPAVQTTGYTAASEKKFKVLLQIGDTLPKFEIRDGEDVLLKVVADKVDVKSPAERSELWATLKAGGQVKFVTPGGEGVCDELQVIPGSGEVVASGSVKFSYNWGKVETAVTSERMTFRLGSAPALAHGEKR
jgi:hypothetical protein